MFELTAVTYKSILQLPHLVLDRPVTCITGPSGSGKSTLLRLLNRLLEPDTGTITYNGKPLTDFAPHLLRRRVAMLGQTPVLYGGTLAEELQVPARLCGYPLPGERDLKKVLAMVGLAKPLDQACDNFSGGEKQRVCFARMLLTSSETYLLDEPTAALDKETELRIMQCLLRVCREKGTPIVLVTHSPQLAELFSDGLLKLVAGRTRGYEK